MCSAPMAGRQRVIYTKHEYSRPLCLQMVAFYYFSPRMLRSIPYGIEVRAVLRCALVL